MTKQTVYGNNFAEKCGFRLQFLRQSAFSTHHCWRGLMTSPMNDNFLIFFFLIFPFLNADAMDTNDYRSNTFQSKQKLAQMTSTKTKFERKESIFNWE